MTNRKWASKLLAHLSAILFVLYSCFFTLSANAQQKKPNILFIMGDDIGWMQPRCYHRGLMVGETPNIDRLANEGGIFMTAYATIPEGFDRAAPHLKKPFTLAQLFGALERILPASLGA